VGPPAVVVEVGDVDDGVGVEVVIGTGAGLATGGAVVAAVVLLSQSRTGVGDAPAGRATAIARSAVAVICASRRSGRGERRSSRRSAGTARPTRTARWEMTSARKSATHTAAAATAPCRSTVRSNRSDPTDNMSLTTFKYIEQRGAA
jgi:hypothetical protein